jgi:hypothetical protein
MPVPYTTLGSLLASHFHRGWENDAASADDVVACILRVEPPDRLRAARAELELILNSGLCEPQLRDLVLYELDCYIDPQLDGLDFSAWLLHLRDRLRDHPGPGG